MGLYNAKVHSVHVYSPLWPDKQLNFSCVFPCLFGLQAEFFFKNFQLSGHGHFRSHSVQSLGDCLLIATACALTSRLPSLANICQSLLKIFPTLSVVEPIAFSYCQKFALRYCQFFCQKLALLLNF